MSTEHEEANTHRGRSHIAAEFLYLYLLVHYRIRQSFRRSGDSDKVAFPPEPQMPHVNKWELLVHHQDEYRELNEAEKILLLVAITPYVYPDLFDKAIDKALREVNADKFIEIGGVTGGKNCPFFLPTGQTVIFLVNGPDKTLRFKVEELFGAEHPFWSRKIIWLQGMPDAEPPMNGRVIMSTDHVHYLTTGTSLSPQFGISFPARKIAPMSPATSGPQHPKPPLLKDLVIPLALRQQIAEMIDWLKYHEELAAILNGRKRGYCALFYGPSGTGKTFTAEILGNELKRDVYKIDLSMVVSKYIGETEKNLELLFSRAEDSGWILFFDEADALFGKRTSVRDAHDKYANQEVSYLLQRIEEYNGLVILATNMKNNIDDAFARRIKTLIKFSIPDEELRARIWRQSFTEGTIFREKVEEDDFSIGVYDNECRRLDSPALFDLVERVKRYELTGGNIVNIVEYAGIRSLARTHKSLEKKSKNQILTIYLPDVLDGIRRELVKEGKPFAG